MVDLFYCPYKSIILTYVSFEQSLPLKVQLLTKLPKLCPILILLGVCRLINLTRKLSSAATSAGWYPKSLSSGACLPSPPFGDLFLLFSMMLLLAIPCDTTWLLAGIDTSLMAVPEILLHNKLNSQSGYNLLTINQGLGLRSLIIVR